MSEKLVSIIAPAYNHEKYIRKCIETVAFQTYKNKELIIIDDCSQDGTCNEIDNIIADERIKANFVNNIKVIKHLSNKGANCSINEGLSAASGFYCTIINTDDLFQLNRIETMVSAMEENNSQFSFSKVNTIDENGNIQENEEEKYYRCLQQKIYKYPLINLTLISDNVAISTGNMFFTKSLYLKVGKFKSYKYIHDWDFILRASLETEPIYVEGTSYLYRLHSNNSFKKLRGDSHLCYEEGMNVLTNFCKRIQTGKYNNTKIPSKNVWKYFIFNILRNKDLAHIWNVAEMSNKFKCY